MEELVSIKNNEVVCTSLQVAEKFSKEHRNVIKAISNQLKNERVKKMFKKSFYVDKKNEKRTMYYMNRDGFSLLVMGFTGEKALDWKVDYIEAFNKMEAMLKERKTVDWQQARQNGKDVRLKETDTIKQLVQYAEEQGSKHADKLYLVYSKLSKTVVKSGRDELTITELNTLNMIESMILKTIQADMCLNMGYKQIYQDCKRLRMGKLLR